MAATPSETIYGQVWSGGVTEDIGRGANIDTAMGYGPVGTEPSSADWTWTSASYIKDKGKDDVYGTPVTVPNAGEHAFAARFEGAPDKGWTYCDQDGSQNGLSKI